MLYAWAILLLAFLAFISAISSGVAVMIARATQAASQAVFLPSFILSMPYIAQQQFPLYAEAWCSKWTNPKTEPAAYAPFSVNQCYICFGVLVNGRYGAAPDTWRIHTMHAGDTDKTLRYPSLAYLRTKVNDIYQVYTLRFGQRGINRVGG
jgi:hypothetical protein